MLKDATQGETQTNKQKKHPFHVGVRGREPRSFLGPQQRVVITFIQNLEGVLKCLFLSSEDATSKRGESTSGCIKVSKAGT